MMSIVVAVIFATILACITAAPVNPKCSIDGEIYAYCNQTPNPSQTKIGINYLYVESDSITDLLVDLCSNYNDIVCGDDCEITPPFQLTYDRDEQNDALSGQLERLKQHLLLFNAPCNGSNTGNDEHSSYAGVCHSLQTAFYRFVQNIAHYLEEERCGCEGSKCYYQPCDDTDLAGTDYTPASLQHVPCTIYNSVKLTQEILDEIRIKRHAA